MKPRSIATDERGGATLLVLFTALFLLAVGALATVWSTISLAHHRASAAADLAALSAAQAIQSGIPNPCAAATRAAATQQATISRCAQQGEAVSVAASVTLRLGALGTPTITTYAHAGPHP
ncbi:hypothetical protein Kfla_0560 [Kribbella flavida DSM 17836]|uniref:Putative Flp pilus-assembly TadG-like N-terminal domain-containing protein n=1 Tax=Kribbella flavida (strain DSM 17836 / JCM 10339 / NBRC 14399) TaxID=479435 RepID=D2PW24_KRIFD|nr:Rv3654c family TadE-like protein [Kribbella flavida]ADB29681.1 hypothetical protein Kfla_0560 [Kribbella flavida DSM 17836]